MGLIVLVFVERRTRGVFLVAVFRLLFFLLLDLDFLLERVLEIGRGLLEFVDAPSERLAKLRELSRPEDDQGDHQDDDQLGHANGTKHMSAPYRPRRPISGLKRPLLNYRPHRPELAPN